MTKWLTTFLLLIVLTGCAQRQASTPEATTGLPSLVPPTPTPTAVFTKPPAQPSETPTATPPKPSDARLKIACLNIEASLPPEASSSSLIMLSDQTEASDGRLKNQDRYFMNMAMAIKLRIGEPGEFISDLSISVSPDRKWIVYELDDTIDKDPWLINPRLVIADAQNKANKILPKEDGWGKFDWLDDQRLIIKLETSNENDWRSTFLVLNPFTGKRETLSPDFPGVYNFHDAPPMAYNPTLSQVVYLQGESGNGELNYVLWDIQQKKQLAGFHVLPPFSAPRWSPDGKQFAVVPVLFPDVPRPAPQGKFHPALGELLEELYSVDSDGKITKLTNLLNYYPRVYIDNFSWSPDGRSIAFWFSPWQDNIDLSDDPIGNRYLAILDTTTGWVTNTCIRGENNVSIGSSKYPAPLWSPNGLQIVVQSQLSPTSFQTVLIDIQKSRAFKIGENLAPMGWMAAP